MGHREVIEHNKALISTTLTKYRNQIVNLHGKKELAHDFGKLEHLIT